MTKTLRNRSNYVPFLKILYFLEGHKCLLNIYRGLKICSVKTWELSGHEWWISRRAAICGCRMISNLNQKILTWIFILLWNRTKHVPYLFYLVNNKRLHDKWISIRVLIHMAHIKTCSITIMSKEVIKFTKIFRPKH